MQCSNSRAIRNPEEEEYWQERWPRKVQAGLKALDSTEKNLYVQVMCSLATKGYLLVLIIFHHQSLNPSGAIFTVCAVDDGGL